MRQLVEEFLAGDQSFLTDQKPGETIFEFIPGFIDFLKPSTEETRIKDPCLNCGFVTTTAIHRVQVEFSHYLLLDNSNANAHTCFGPTLWR